MSTALPVIQEAYRRLVRPPQDPYGISGGAQLEEARQHIAKAELLSLQSCGNCLTNATLLSQDLLFAIVGDPGSASPIYTRQESKCNGSPQYTVTESETGDIIYSAVRERLERFWKVWDRTQTDAYAAAGNTPTATNLYPATQYCAASESTTSRGPVEARHSWLRAVYDLVRSGQTLKALRVIYSSIEDLLRREDLVALADVLAEVDLNRLNPQSMVALLRISARAKKSVPAWAALLDRTAAELKRLHVPDLPGLLIGLQK